MPKILALPPQIVVEAFDRVEGSLRAVLRRAAATPETARRLAAELAPRHAGIVIWRRSFDAELGDYAAPEELFRTGETPPSGPG